MMVLRREFLKGAVAVGGASALSNKAAAISAGSIASNATINLPIHAEDAARRPFDASSTAEYVTEGIDLTGKTALITGSTSGIGLETLRVLVLRGSHVLAFGRTLEKARQACAEVITVGTKGKATPVACEQSDYESVVSAANAVHALGTPIDILICNAGLNVPTLEQVRGIEKHFAVHHLSHFILVTRLLGLVKAAPQGRVVMVSSIMYQDAPPMGIDFNNLSGEQGVYDWAAMYGQSKLANGLFSRELARRLAGTAATSNALHPGLIPTHITDVWRNFTEERHDEKRMPKHFLWNRKWSLFNSDVDAREKTLPQGAATQCYVATHPSLRRVSGAYFRDCHIAVPGSQMRNDALAVRLWRASEDLTRPFLSPD